jgi:DNA-binding transcriptional LysR family regulator
MALTSSRVRALNAVVEEGGFTAAARRLGVSQPAITQHIRELQQEFGVVLFEKHRNAVVPTALCRDLYRITQDLRRLEDDAVALLRQYQAIERGALRVGLANAMPGMRLIGAFQARHPGISVHVEMGSWGRIMDAIVEQRIDVGVLPDVPDDPRFRRVACAEQDVVALLHPDHPLAERTSLDLRDLARERLVFRTPESCTQKVLGAAFARAGLAPSPALVVDSPDGVVEAVANRLGIGFVFRSATTRADGLMRIPVADLLGNVKEHVFHLAHPAPSIAPHFMHVAAEGALG